MHQPLTGYSSMVERRCFLFRYIIASETCGSNPQNPITPAEVNLSESIPQTKRLINDDEEDMQHEKYYSDYQRFWS